MSIFSDSIKDHRKVTISGNAPGWFEVIGLLEEDVTISLSSQFSKISDNIPQGIKDFADGLNTFGAALGIGASGSFQQMGIQTWTGTEPLSVQLTVAFYTVNDPVEDVYKPMRILTKLPLPRATGSLGNLAPPGPALKNAFIRNRPSNSQNNNNTDNGSQGYLINVKIGTLCILKNVLIKEANPWFSESSAASGNIGTNFRSLRPMFGRVQLQIISVMTATSDYLFDSFRIS